MPRTRPQITPGTRLAAAWERCARARARPLSAHYRLGRGFQRVIDALPYGEKEDLLLDVLRAVRRNQPDCTRSHLQNKLYRSARFARCCDDDPKLLDRLERAGLRWWAICELLSVLVRRLEAPKRDRQAISKVLNQGLATAANGRCTPGELVVQLKSWRHGHPSYFRGRWNHASMRAAHAKVRGKLDEAEQAWAVFLKHAGSGNEARAIAFKQAIQKARSAVDHFSDLLGK